MSQAEIASLETTLIRPVLTELSAQSLFEKCHALARNLWWSWQPEVINLFRDLDPIRWRQLDHNPVALLSEFTPERLEMRAAELALYSRINYNFRRLKDAFQGAACLATCHKNLITEQMYDLITSSHLKGNASKHNSIITLTPNNIIT